MIEVGLFPIDTVRRLNAELDRITLAPAVLDRWADAASEEGYHLVLEERPIRDASRPTEPRAKVPGGVVATFLLMPRDVHELAVDVVAAQVMGALHESLEWIRVDGDRIADPHPVESNQMWPWLAEACRAVVQEYVLRHPPSRSTVSQPLDSNV